MKTCACCKQTKPLSDFPPRANRPSGVHSSCRPCRQRQQREYYLRNRVERPVVETGFIPPTDFLAMGPADGGRWWLALGGLSIGGRHEP